MNDTLANALSTIMNAEKIAKDSTKEPFNPRRGLVTIVDFPFESFIPFSNIERADSQVIGL